MDVAVIRALSSARHKCKNHIHDIGMGEEVAFAHLA